MERRVAVVVEDDDDIRDLVVHLLGQSGFTVHEAASGAAGVAAVREHDPVVVTVDLGLADIDGYEVTRQVRQFSDAYVVMLTARTEEIETLMGLESGADDYITKPFRPRELRARIEAMLRRPRTPLPAEPPVAAPADQSGRPGRASAPVGPPVTAPADLQPAGSGPTPAAGSTPPAAAQPPSTGPAQPSPLGPESPSPGISRPLVDPAGHARLELDGLALYPHLHLVEVSGHEVPVTPTEFLLLETLLRSGRVVRSKRELARIIRGDDVDGGSYVSAADERTVEVHVGNVRRKLQDDPREPRWVETVRGVGYRMADSAIAVS